jgi:RNA polymerase sigma-70 factor (ECF subfamily)
MNFDGVDDVTLIRLIADAHTGAVQELYDRYNRLVFSVALAVLGDRSVAEEATLDVFVRVWQGAKTYRPDRAKVNTWLVAITRHHAIDILRWQNSRPDVKSLSLDDLSLSNGPAVPDTEQHVESSLQRARVRNAVAQLPPDQRQALVLAYFKGYSHQQISDVLKQPLGTIKTRIRLAMQKLRETLLDDGSDTSESV